jgi:hypothetical protein
MRRRLVHPLERERRLVQIRRKVRLAVGPLDWPERLRWWRYRATPILVPLGIGAAVLATLFVLWLLALPSAWTIDQRLRHIASTPGCGWARAVGRAPPQRREPGDRANHHPHGDGIACEPFVPDRNLSLRQLTRLTWATAAHHLWARPPSAAAEP